MNLQKDKPWRSKAYLQWIRSQPCVVTGQTPSDPHHVVGVKLSGMGTKVGDEFCIPLCRSMHTKLHRDPKTWSILYGTQLSHLDRIQKKAVKDGMLEPFLMWRTGL